MNLPQTKVNLSQEYVAIADSDLLVNFLPKTYIIWGSNLLTLSVLDDGYAGKRVVCTK